MGATELIIQIVGYLGGILVLYAYYMVSSNRTKGDSLHYQFYNILGALCLIINTAYHGAYPSMGVNIVWIVVAIVSLRRSHALKTVAGRLRIGGRKKGAI